MKQLDLNHIETSGLTLIEASAGTGKTWTITALYILLLLEQRMRPEEILVVTYTNAATAELRDRIRKRIADTLDLYVSGREPADELEKMLVSARTTDPDTARKLLTRALYAFDDAAIFTIHGFCRRALLENAFESGSLFDTELTGDQSALVRQVCDDFWRSRIMTDEGPFLEHLIAEGYTPDKLAAPFDGHYQDHALRIIPETCDPDLTALIGECEALLPPVADMWRAEREAVIRQLHQANLSQTSYKPERIEAAALKLDACLADGSLRKWGDALPLFTMDKIVSGMKKGSILPHHPFFGLCQQLAEAVSLVDRSYSYKLIHRRTELQGWLRGELARRKQALNLRSYDDLLLDLHLALEGSGGERLAASLRERYHAALIDEFQDTDPLQWRIFARIAGLPCPPPQPSPSGGGSISSSPQRGEARRGDEVGNGREIGTFTHPLPPSHQGMGNHEATSYPLFLIGDPKQAIYSFRGADIYAYIAAARATEHDKRWTLSTNRRSSPPLVTAINTVFKTADDPFLSSEIGFSEVEYAREQQQQLLCNGRPVEQPLRFWVHQRRDQSKPAGKGAARTAAVSATAAEIARLLDGSYEFIGKDGGRRTLGPGDIAVLVKAHFQADQIQEALSTLGIPSVQHGSTTIFETREALDLLRILRAAADPVRSALVREALLTSVIGLSANEVFALHDDEKAWELWMMRFRALHDAARTGGVIAMASRLLGECGVRKQALSHAGGERRLTNILHCSELLHQAEREHGAGLEGSIAWLEQRITGKQEDETTLLRLETDDDAVTLATIHASKGLEYPVVFLPFAWDPPSTKKTRVLFHDDDGSLVLDLGTDKKDKEHKHKAKVERDAEAARLLYVALTRAKFLCYVTWGCINESFGSPLRRLLHGSGFKDAKAFGAAKDREILADIAALADKAATEDTQSPISAELMSADKPAPSRFPEHNDSQGYVCRGLHGAIPSDWRVSSFSAIAGHAERQLQPHDYDALPPSAGLTAVAEAPTYGDSTVGEAGCGLSIFDFPRGAAAGTCLHELFEQLDFAADMHTSLEPLALACLLRNGYERSWLPAVLDMVNNVISAPLIPDDPDFSLSRLKSGSWLTELEFFLPLAGLSGNRLRELFSGLLDPERHGSFQDILVALQVQETRGMLQGFMDMVIEHRGRYYLIDWKSNHLGDRRDDYRQSALRESMAQHAYILQYHLYTLALDRLLRLRLPDYDYSTHFGGAIYVYLRGVSANAPHCGIYRDRPSPEFVRRANELLLA